MKAAIKLQSWYRAHITRMAFRVQILLKLGMIRKRQMEEVELMLNSVTRIQCAFRAKLARQKVMQVRADDERRALTDVQEGETDTFLIDTWHPRSAAAGIEFQRPRPDRELEKLEEAGLVPFYGSSSQQLVRHRIGGPSALKSLRLLGLGASPHEVSQEEVEEEDFEAPGKLWDVYPEGISASFLEKLDTDAWPWERPGRTRGRGSKRVSAKRRFVLGLGTAPRASTSFAQLPPSHAERRASQRKSLRDAAASEADAAGEATVKAELHPLLMGGAPLPPEPQRPQPPTAPPPRGRPRGHAARYAGSLREVRGEAAEDASWGGVTSFYASPPPSPLAQKASPQQRFLQLREAEAEEEQEDRRIAAVTDRVSAAVAAVLAAQRPLAIEQ